MILFLVASLTLLQVYFNQVARELILAFDDQFITIISLALAKFYYLDQNP